MKYTDEQVENMIKITVGRLMIVGMEILKEEYEFTGDQLATWAERVAKQVTDDVARAKSNGNIHRISG